MTVSYKKFNPGPKIGINKYNNVLWVLFIDQATCKQHVIEGCLPGLNCPSTMLTTCSLGFGCTTTHPRNCERSAMLYM